MHDTNLNSAAPYLLLEKALSQHPIVASTVNRRKKHKFQRHQYAVPCLNEESYSTIIIPLP
jgi:hypothetical protein